MSEFHKGQQIIYIPNHADGDKQHPDCERGFVYKGGTEFAWCRFWRKDAPGTLRTRANSERTPCENLKRSPGYIPQEIVDAWLSILDWENS